MTQFRKNANGSLKWSHPAGVKSVPDVVALNQTVNDSLDSSSEITLNTATSFLQVYAITKDVYLKWGTDDCTAANFDEVIPAGKIMNFLVPEGQTAINLLERESAATAIVLEK